MISYCIISQYITYMCVSFVNTHTVDVHNFVWDECLRLTIFFWWPNTKDCFGCLVSPIPAPVRYDQMSQTVGSSNIFSCQFAPQLSASGIPLPHQCKKRWMLCILCTLFSVCALPQNNTAPCHKRREMIRFYLIIRELKTHTDTLVELVKLLRGMKCFGGQVFLLCQNMLHIYVIQNVS